MLYPPLIGSCGVTCFMFLPVIGAGCRGPLVSLSAVDLYKAIKTIFGGTVRITGITMVLLLYGFLIIAKRF